MVTFSGTKLFAISSDSSYNYFKNEDNWKFICCRMFSRRPQSSCSLFCHTWQHRLFKHFKFRIGLHWAKLWQSKYFNICENEQGGTSLPKLIFIFEIRTILCSNSGNSLVTRDDNNDISLWDVATKRLVFVYPHGANLSNGKVSCIKYFSYPVSRSFLFALLQVTKSWLLDQRVDLL